MVVAANPAKLLSVTANSPIPTRRRPALFLDRDGVLNEDRGYVHLWEDFCWVPGAQDAIAAFNRAGWLVFVVTNQSGVGRGYYTEEHVKALHGRMAKALEDVGGWVDAFYYCPDHPQAVDLRYRHPDPPDRKPNPGMLLRAMSEWPVNADLSLMIGDKDGDLEAGRRAGVRARRFEGGDLLEFLAQELTRPYPG
ncbi:MAG: D,D-heptose 1,7-bisphosphate phosphatase [Phenylobacterium zucineum]|nr:MAG: D,D-heptose 1,7-bisphosphate phosphatase [Phenylobacterium zucineum]